MDEYREVLAPPLIEWQEISVLRDALATDRPYREGGMSRLSMLPAALSRSDMVRSEVLEFKAAPGVGGLVLGGADAAVS